MAKKNKRLSLAIYGCSFADPTCGPDHLHEHAWPNLLKKDYSVDVYSESGSSLFYSYKKFLETHHQYDKIIFSQTFHGRWFNPIVIDDTTTHLCHYSQIMDVKKWINEENKKLDIATIKKLEALEYYYLYLEEEYTSKLIDKALLYHIKSLRKDTIVIPDYFWRKTQDAFISKFSLLDRKNWFKDPMAFIELNLIAHFPIEYHIEIYKAIKESIKTNVFSHFNVDIESGLSNDFDYYFTPK